MKPHHLFLLAVALLCGCQHSRLSPGEFDARRHFVGRYYRSDGLGYDISLNLKSDGSYDAEWRGCLGLYGTACGIWSISGEHIVLTPSKERDLMEGHLRQLDMVRRGDRWILVQSDDRELYDTRGVSRYSCFQKSEATQ